MDNKIGERLKYLRVRKGISQFDLETQIDISMGTLSRIESGKVNPQKETLFKVADALELNDIDRAYLFGMSLDSFSRILSLMNQISVVQDQDEIFRVAVNELAKIMGYVICAVFLRDSEDETKIWGQDFAQNEPTRIVWKLVDRPIKTMWVDEVVDKGNLPLRSAVDNKVYQTSDFYDIGRGTVSRPIMRSMQVLAKIHDSIIFPLSIGEDSVGSLLCVKPKTIDYTTDRLIIGSFAKHLGYKFNSVYKSGSKSLQYNKLVKGRNKINNLSYAEILTWLQN